MRRFVFLLIASSTICVVNAQPIEDARNSLHALALRLSTFEPGDYIYNRLPSEDDWYRQVQANYSPSVLVQLLGNASPRVRTLAMALLFSKEDPKLLLPVARLFSDTAPTFPKLLPTANADPHAIETQTVGDVAKEMLGTYLFAAGSGNWRDPGFADWVAYDAGHRDRRYSLSWLIVRLSRVTRMQMPFFEARRPLLLQFRKELDSLPPQDRELYLLWLCHGNPDFDGGSELATETEQVDAARRLGRRELLEIIDGHPPGTDPDLLPGPGWQSQSRYRAIVSFLLSHAGRLFTRADEPFLAALERREKDKIARGVREDLELVPLEALERARAVLLQKAG